MNRPAVISCSVFSGRNPLTGKRVGKRRRCGGGSWGVGCCEFCGRNLSDVLEKPVQKISLEQAIRNGLGKGDKAEWHPHWEAGHSGSETGWYIKRQLEGSWGLENLKTQTVCWRGLKQKMVLARHRLRGTLKRKPLDVW